MRLRTLFFFFILAVFILILIFFINGTMLHPTPPGLNLTVSESISPNVGVFVLNSNKKEASSIDENEFFFLQQRGLPEGTIYGFRVVNERGIVIMPVYETFKAKTSDWIEPNKYYRHIRPGNQTVELLIIEDSNGIVIARTNIFVFNFKSIIINMCGNLTNEPVVDAGGWSREGKITDCAANIAIESKNAYACKELGPFNLSILGYEDCIRKYAAATGDTSACDELGMPKSRGFCKAKVTNDWTECRKVTCDISCSMEGLETQQDLCIQWYAIENRNTSLCNEITSTAYNMKEICLNITANDKKVPFGR